MTFSYSNAPSSLELALIEESTQILLNEYSKQCADAEQLCVNVTFTSSGNTLRVSKKENSAPLPAMNQLIISAVSITLFITWMRILTLKKQAFSKNGFMLDCSRNAVSTVNTVKINSYYGKAGA